MGRDRSYQVKRLVPRSLPLVVALALPLLLAACGSLEPPRPPAFAPGATPAGIYLMTVTGTPNDGGGTIRIAARNLSDGRERWHYTAAWSLLQSYPLPLVVADGLVLYASFDFGALSAAPTSAAPPSGYVTALRASDGRQLWRVALGVLPSLPVVAHGVVYVTSVQDASHKSQKDVYALNAADGFMRWHVRLPSDGTLGLDNLTVAGDTLFIAANKPCEDYCDGADLWALRTSDGATVWKTSIQGTQSLSTPVVANGLVYEQRDVRDATGDSLGVFAYDAATGKERWRALTYTSEHSGLEIKTPVIAGGAAYMTAGDPAQPGAGKVALIARNGATGAQLWRVMAGADPQLLAVSGQTLYLDTENANGSGYLFSAYRASDGRRLWQTPVSARLGLAVADSTQVYVSYNPDTATAPPNAVMAYRASDGGTVWSAPTVGATSLLAEADGAIYALHEPTPTDPGKVSQPYPNLIALQPADGHVLFDLPLPGNASIAQGVVVVS